MSSANNLADGSNFALLGRWDGGNYGGASNRPTVVSQGVNGTNKCLRFQRLASDTALNCCLAFNFDAPVGLGKKIFSSAIFKHSSNSLTGGQWKYDRYQRSTTSISDKAREIYFNASSSTPDNKVQGRDGTYTGSSGSNWSKFGSSNVTYMPHNKNTWVRMDRLITLPTAYGAAGATSFKIETWVWYSPSQVPFYTSFLNNQAVDQYTAFAASGDEWLQHVYQNYWGSGTGDFSESDHVLLMDKMYESVGDDDWRVEFANNADYALATKSYIQPISSWNGVISIPKADKGDLTTGWLHVIKNGVSVYSEAKI